MSGWKHGLLLLSALCLVDQAAKAADLDMPSFAPQTADPVVEFGTGWYLRGDVGLGKETQAKVVSGQSASTPSTTYDFSAGVGYKFNTWFRTDLTYDFGRPLKTQQSGSATIICPYALYGQTQQGSNKLLGYNWSTQAGTCTAKNSATVNQSDVLLNAYADLGTWLGLTPYIGAGIGVAQIQSQQSGNYYKTSDGSVYDADLSVPSGNLYPLVWNDATGKLLDPQPVVPGKGTPVAFGKQDWSYYNKRTRYNLAWALMGGVGYALTDHATLDIGYRYLNRGTFKSLPGPDGSVVSKSMATQEIRVGLRYQID